MRCKRCDGKKLVKIKTTEVNPYVVDIEYICSDCKTVNYKTKPTMGAYYSIEKFNF